MYTFSSSSLSRPLLCALSLALASPVIVNANPLLTKTYHIPAGVPLDKKISAIAAQNGIALSFNPSLTKGLTSPAVSGDYTPKQVLDALLVDSQLMMIKKDDGSYTLVKASKDVTLKPIEVTGVLYGAKETSSLHQSSASVGIISDKEISYGQMSYIPQSLRRLANVEKGATNNTGIVIRGMNFEGFSPAGAPMGSIYVDGILQTRYNSRFGARSLFDAEQVEVYRGPQATLSGRAATAGAIYLKTKDPSFNKEIVLSGTLGNKGLKGTGFIVNTPLIEDEVALRIAGQFEEMTTEMDYPTYRNFDNYDEFRTELSGNLRAKLLFEPELLPDTSALLTYSYSKDRPNERLADPGPGNRGDFYQFSTFAEFREIDVHNLGFEVTHHINDALKLTSQTSVSHGITERESVDNGTSNIVNAFFGSYDDTLFSQELRLNYVQDQWSWVTGVFASYEDQDSEFFARLTEWGIEQEQFFYRETTNLALFGEATYEFIPSWKFTLGARLDYLKEKTDETDIMRLYPANTLASFSTNQASISEVNFVPKVALSKAFNQDHIAGVTYSQGFRTGGFYVNSGTGEAETYDAEYADNYELFYKGTFLNQRLRLNTNIFYTKYKDQQVESTPAPGLGSGTIVNNAASSYAFGFEFEPTFDVNNHLSVFTSVGYLRTKFEDFDHRTYGDLSGEQFPEAPKWSVAFGGLYQFDNGVYIGGDAKYLSGYTARFSTNAPLDKIDSRFIANMQAGIKKENWELNVYAENLFDKEYYTMTELESSPAFSQVGPSRLVGVNAIVKF